MCLFQRYVLNMFFVHHKQFCLERFLHIQDNNYELK
jgi:hypothetical protein